MNSSELVSHAILKLLTMLTTGLAKLHSGLTGICGIGPALGACSAILTGSKCGFDQEQRRTMEFIFSRVVRTITRQNGPSCCKAYIWKKTH